MLEDLQEHLKVCKTKREEARSHEEAVDGTLVDIRIGVEHLTSKMHNLKLPKNLTYMQGQVSVPLCTIIYPSSPWVLRDWLKFTGYIGT